MIQIVDFLTGDGGVLIAVSGGVLLGAYLLVWGVNGVRRATAVWSHDPVPIGESHLEEGTIEVEGTAESLGETLTSPYGDATCLAYSYSKKRKERRTDEDGNTTTEWDTVASGSDSVPFAVVDDTGSIPIDPEGATLGMDGDHSSRRGDVKRTESRIDPGDGIHVIGQKRSTAETDRTFEDASAFIGDGDAAPTFRITEGGELETVARMFGRSLLALALGVGLIAASGYGVTRVSPEAAALLGL